MYFISAQKNEDVSAVMIGRDTFISGLLDYNLGGPYDMTSNTTCSLSQAVRI